jgi:hypothetical protein
MGKKLHWHKTFSDRYLADRETVKLSLAQHGLLHIINCILRTQTDHPGRYIIRGRIGTLSELTNDALMYAHGSHKAPKISVTSHIHRLLAAHLIEQDPDGLLYSPYICQEVAESKVNEVRGRLGGNPALCKPDNPPLKPEKKREEKKRREGKPDAENVDNSGSNDPRARRDEPAKAARAGLVHISKYLPKREDR